MKTSLLGLSGPDLARVFDQAEDMLIGRVPVSDHVAEIVSTWWEEMMTAVDNVVEDAKRSHQEDPDSPPVLVRYSKYSALPKEQGGHAETIQGWDFHLGLAIKRLDELGIPYNIITLPEGE